MSNSLEHFSQESKLPNSVDVFRVQRIDPLAFREGKDQSKPPIDLFNLSSRDKQEGLDRKKRPLLSVWNSKIPREDLFKNTKVTDSQKAKVYRLNVRKIHSISTMSSRMIPLEAHCDPRRELPSGEFHAGIQGLHKIKGLKRENYKRLKRELVKISELHDF